MTYNKSYNFPKVENYKVRCKLCKRYLMRKDVNFVNEHYYCKDKERCLKEAKARDNHIDRRVSRADPMKQDRVEYIVDIWKANRRNER